MPNREELERAIEDFENYKAMGYSQFDRPSSWSIELAIEALRAELSRQENAPLEGESPCTQD